MAQTIDTKTYRARRRTLLWNLRFNRKWGRHYNTPTLIERLVECRAAYYGQGDASC
jgi:hypothetical protein